MGGSSSDVRVNIDGDASGLQRALGRAEGGLLNLRNASRAAAGVIAAATGEGLRRSIRSAADFDQAMTNSTAIMGDVSSAMRNDMSDAARQVAKTTTFSASQAADAYFYLASAGFDAKQSIDAMPRVAKFAQAGNFDLARATDIATDAQSALGLASDDAAENLTNLNRVMDVTVKANTLANATVEEFGEALMNAGADMDQFDMSVEEGTAVLAAFADTGLKGSEAGTALSRVMNEMSQRAIENSDAFEDLGIAVFDADGNMRPMADIIEDMEGAFEGMSDEARIAALQQLGFSKATARNINRLMGQSDAIREYEEELKNAGGTVDEVAEKQLQTFNAQMAILKSNIVDVGLSIGLYLLPMLTNLVMGITSVVSSFADWVAAGNEGKTLAAMLAVGFGSLAFAIGLPLTPILALIAAVSLLVRAWRSDFGGIRTETMRVVDAIRGDLWPAIQRAFMAIRSIVGTTSPIFEALGRVVEAVVGGIVGIVATVLVATIEYAAQVIHQRVVDMQNAWLSHGGALRSMFRMVADHLTAWADRVDETLGSIGRSVDFLVAIWRAGGDDVRSVTDAVQKDSIHPLVRVTWELVMAVRAGVGLMGDLWSEYGHIVTGVATMIVTAVGRQLIAQLRALWDITVIVAGFGARLWERYGNTARDAALAIAAAVGWLAIRFGILNSATSGIASVIARLGAVKLGLLGPIGLVLLAVTTLYRVWTSNFMGIQEHVTRFVEITRTAFDAIAEFVNAWGPTLLTAISAIIEGVVGFFTDLYQRLIGGSIIPDMFEAILAYVLGWIPRFLGALGDMIIQATELWFEFANYILAEVVPGLFVGIIDFVEEWGPSFLEWLSEWALTVAEGFYMLGETLVSEVFPVVFERLLAFVIEWGPSFLEWLSEFASTVIEGFMQLGETLITETFPAIFIALIEFAREWGPSFLEWLGEFASTVIEGFMQLGETLITETFPTVFEAILEFVREWGPVFIEWVVEFGGQVLEAFGEWLGTFVTEVLPDWGGQVLDWLREWGPVVIEWVVEHGTAVLEAYADWMNAFVGETLPEWGGEILAWLVEHGGEFVESLVELGIGALEAYADWMNELVGERLPEWAGQVIEWLGEHASEFIDSLVELGTDALEAYADWMNELVGERLPEWAGEVLAWLGEHASEFVETLTELGTDALEAYADWMNDLVGERLPQFASDVISWLGELASEFVSGIGEMASDATDAMFDALPTVEEMKQYGKDILIAIRDGIKEAIPDVGGAMGEAADRIRSYLPFSDAKRGALSDLSTAADNIPGMVIDGITARLGDVGSAAGEIASNVMDNLPTISELKERGEGIASSFGEGIKTGVGKAKDGANAVADGVRGFFGSSNAREGPLSDVTGAGEGVIDAYAGAMESMETRARTAGSNIAGAILDGLLTIMGNLGAFANSTGRFFDKWASDRTAQLTKWGANAGRAIQQATRDMARTIQRWGSDTRNTLNRWVSQTRSEIDRWSNQSQRTIGRWASQTTSEIGRWASRTRADIASWSNQTRNALSTWANQTRNAFSTWSNQVRSTISSWSSQTRSTIGSWSSQTRSAITAWSSTTRSIFSSWSSAIRTTVMGAMGQVRSLITSGMSASRSAMASGMSAMRSAMSSGMSAIRSAASSGMSGVRSAVRSGMSSAVSAVRGARSSFRSAGASLASSVASGIRSRISSVRSAARSLASAARSALPGSDAEWGPLSDLTAASRALPETFANEIARGKGLVARAMGTMLTGVDANAQLDAQLGARAPSTRGGNRTMIVEIGEIHASGRREGRDAGRAISSELSRAFRSDNF